MPATETRLKKVTAVVVTYNAGPWIRQGLESLRKSTLPVSVIVVDNHSSDDTVQVIQKNFPEVLLVRNQFNLGFGKANNLGIKHALERGADYIFLMNQDAWVSEDTLEQLLAAASRHPEYYIVSPVHYQADGRSMDLGFAFYISMAGDENPDHANTGMVEVPFVNAALWLMPGEAITTIGGFDPLFFLYGEDNDLIHRVHYHGKKAGVVKEAIAYHDRSPFRNPSLAYLKNRRRSEHLIQLKNINRSWSDALWNFFRRSIKRMIKTFIYLRWRFLYIELSVFFSLLFSLNTIRRHRILSQSGQTMLWIE